MASRIRVSVPYSGTKYHREHRSKKGRKNIRLKDKTSSLRKKKILELLKIKDLEYERSRTIKKIY